MPEVSVKQEAVQVKEEAPQAAGNSAMDYFANLAKPHKDTRDILKDKVGGSFIILIIRLHRSSNKRVFKSQ